MGWTEREVRPQQGFLDVRGGCLPGVGCRVSVSAREPLLPWDSILRAGCGLPGTQVPFTWVFLICSKLASQGGDGKHHS